MKILQKNNVKITVDNNLCISCGVCKNICPKDCISFQRNKGLYVPVIDDDKCISCSMCAKVCSGLKMDFEQSDNPEEVMYGNILVAYNAWSDISIKRHMSASGGVLSTLIPNLLKKNQYDGVFVVDSYDYREQLKTVLKCKDDFEGDWETKSIPKSRYLPVSHENAVKYIKENPKKKLIIIGTSCAIRGISKIVKTLQRERSQYLFIGLFCDKVFNYNVIDYYMTDKFSKDRTLVGLHFKNKESGGWPGNMKFLYSDNSYEYFDKNNRVSMKEYFMPERCLYCIDKLNIMADISIGDNYTGYLESSLGSNSVIIRSEIGSKAWNDGSENIIFHEIAPNLIYKAQVLSDRAKNAMFAKTKECEIVTDNQVVINDGIDADKADYGVLKCKLRAGELYRENPKLLDKQISKQNFTLKKARIRGYISKAVDLIFKKRD